VSSVGGGGALGPLSSAAIIVPANSDPHGVLAFAVPITPAREDAPGGSVAVTVTRAAGSIGEVSVRWSASGVASGPAIAAGVAASFDAAAAPTLAAAVLLSMPPADGTWVTLAGPDGVARLAIHTEGRQSRIFAVGWGGTLREVGDVVSHEEGAVWAGVPATANEGAPWLAILVSPNQDSFVYIYTPGKAPAGLQQVQTIPGRATAVAAFVSGAPSTAHVLIGLADAAEASTLYWWSEQNVQLVTLSTVALRGPMGLTPLHVDGQVFVAAAVVDPDAEPASSSAVFHLVDDIIDGGNKARLEAVSATATTGAQSWTMVQQTDAGLTLALASTAGVHLFGFRDGQLIAPTLLTNAQARSVAAVGGRGRATADAAALLMLATTHGSSAVFRVTNASAGGSKEVTAITANFAGITAAPISAWATLDRDSGLLLAAQTSGVPNADAAASHVVRILPIATAGDFAPASGVVVFAEGEIAREVTLNVFADGLPELAEGLVLTLLGDTVTGGARVGNEPTGGNTTLIVISPSDDPEGVVGFAAQSLAVIAGESSANRPVTLRVVRTGGANGPATVTWRVMEMGVTDVAPTAGTVVFAHGQYEQSFVVTILADSEPEISEHFTLRLDTITGGARFDDATRQAVLTIRGNDDVHGVVAVSLPAVTADALPLAENAGFVQITLSRTMGTVGDVQVTLSVYFCQAQHASVCGTLTLILPQLALLMLWLAMYRIIR